MESRMRKLYRKAKDTWKQYDDAEIRVREATSNDPWGASSSMMSRIADDCDHPLRYQSMFTMLYKRMTDLKHYKHILKSLHLVEYLLKNANTRFVHDITLRKDILVELSNYKFVENGIDCGEEIRRKADAIIALIDDEEKLREERESARNTKGRISALDHRSSRGSFMADDRNNARKKSLNRYDDEVDWEDVEDVSPLENDARTDSEEERRKAKKNSKAKKRSPDLKFSNEGFDDAEFEVEEKELSEEEDVEVIPAKPVKQKTPERQVTSPKRAPVVPEKPKANKNSFLDELDLLPSSNAVKHTKSLDDIFNTTQSGIETLFDNVKPASLALPAPVEEKKEAHDPLAMIDVSLLEERSPKDGEEWTYLTNFDDLHVPMTKVRETKKKEIRKAISAAKPKLSKIKEEKGGELVVYNPAAPATGYGYGYTGQYYGYQPYGYGYQATGNAMVVFDPTASANATALKWN